ncbi:MAG: hypothetical protein JNM19_11770 [Chitinophagaceae bacterium]|nr:hypothetical protein [Chitinophagaceae bacterium]
MKKTLLLAFIVAAMISCKDKKKSPENRLPESKQTATTATTAEDEALATWLKGKMLTASDTKLDYNNFKLYADGTCEDKGAAKTSWTIEGGKLNIGGMMKISIEKKDEQTIILHRSLSDETYQVVAIP